MRKLLPFSIFVLGMVLFAANTHAEKYELGGGIAVKVDYIHFTDSILDHLNAQDGIYVGVEAYKQLFFPNFFLGMEVGWAGTSGTNHLIDSSTSPSTDFEFGTDVNYVPIEFNAKYVIPINPCWDFGFGAGFSINYLDLHRELISPQSQSFRVEILPLSSNWAWGGQFFGELNYKYQNWFFGINAKYQLTEEIEFQSPAGFPGVSSGISADNFRIGGQVGMKF